MKLQDIIEKYSNIENKIPKIWNSYEIAGIELAQDLSIGHWDITNSELYRVICLISYKIPDLNLTKHLDLRFSYMGLYPHIIKFPMCDKEIANEITKQGKLSLENIQTLMDNLFDKRMKNK